MEEIAEPALAQPEAIPGRSVIIADTALHAASSVA
jgi:hypothetical protein